MDECRPFTGRQLSPLQRRTQSIPPPPPSPSCKQRWTKVCDFSTLMNKPLSVRIPGAHKQHHNSITSALEGLLFGPNRTSRCSGCKCGRYSRCKGVSPRMYHLPKGGAAIPVFQKNEGNSTCTRGRRVSKLCLEMVHFLPVISFWILHQLEMGHPNILFPADSKRYACFIFMLR